MKKCFFLFAFLPLFFVAQNAAKKARVLFLGNSYTYVNNLPDLIAGLALSQHDSLIYDSYCPGGYTFYNHFTDATSVAKIAQGNWDYVVLQAQSQEPSFSPNQVSTQTLPYAIKLDSLIKLYNSCANTVFYETWGRKFGDASNCAAYPPICTYPGMQNRLKASYKLFADTVHDIMAPVGEAFRKSIALQPTLDLYQSDQSHPSLEGSFLAAAVFYETLFQKSAISCTYNPGISATNATFLLQTANQVLRDSLYTWNIGKYLPWAAFPVVSTGPQAFQFFSVAPSYNQTWYFGDGSGSTAVNPVHTYSAGGTYTVSHVTGYWCKEDSATKVITVTGPVSTNLASQQINDRLTLYPNPCSNIIQIDAPSYCTPANTLLEINDALGRLVYQGDFSTTIQTHQWHNGIYFVKVSNRSAVLHSCFIKND